MSIVNFSDRLLAWFDQHGRKDLPWQHDINAYRVWVSEIMLQQTQVKTVIPYYEKFMHSFPDVHSLALADEDHVLHHWAGLGYYARARNLHKTAKIIHDDFHGEFPRNIDEVIALPGIGRSTAGAICSIAFKQNTPILDGNVKRVLARCHRVDGWPGNKKVLDALWEIAEDYTPEQRTNDYTQAIMDIGATLCTRSKPDCPSCPFAQDCQANQLSKPEFYPGKKPKKVLPVKATQMLILQQQLDAQTQVLVYKRPNQGIWGGLWSLPEIPPEQSLEHWLIQQGIKSSTQQSLASMRHTFSHYHLDIQPQLIEVEQLQQQIHEGQEQRWYPLEQGDTIGLAAPVQKLLKQLTSTT